MKKQGGTKYDTFNDNFITFHLSGIRNLRHFYLFYVCKHLRSDFPKYLFHNRFSALQQRVAIRGVKQTYTKQKTHI